MIYAKLQITNHLDFFKIKPKINDEKKPLIRERIISTVTITNGVENFS